MHKSNAIVYGLLRDDLSESSELILKQFTSRVESSGFKKQVVIQEKGRLRSHYDTEHIMELDSISLTIMDQPQKITIAFPGGFSDIYSCRGYFIGKNLGDSRNPKSSRLNVNLVINLQGLLAEVYSPPRQ